MHHRGVAMSGQEAAPDRQVWSASVAAAKAGSISAISHGVSPWNAARTLAARFAVAEAQEKALAPPRYTSAVSVRRDFRAPDHAMTSPSILWRVGSWSDVPHFSGGVWPPILIVQFAV